jgi:hypothetical protein
MRDVIFESKCQKMSDGRSSGSLQYGFPSTTDSLWVQSFCFVLFGINENLLKSKKKSISLFCPIFQKLWKFFEFNSEARGPFWIW